jgi:hypothetical protein
MTKYDLAVLLKLTNKITEDLINMEYKFVLRFWCVLLKNLTFVKHLIN